MVIPTYWAEYFCLNLNHNNYKQNIQVLHSLLSRLFQLPPTVVTFTWVCTHTHTQLIFILIFLKYATSMLVKLQWFPKFHTVHLWLRPIRQLLSFISYLYHASQVHHSSNQTGNFFTKTTCILPSLYFLEMPLKFTTKIVQTNVMAPLSPIQL